MISVSKTKALQKGHEDTFMRAEMSIVRWMLGDCSRKKRYLG